MALLGVLCSLLLFRFDALKTANHAINVDVFYESRCPFSLAFLNTTLRNTWDDVALRQRMNLRLHPFGNGHIVPEEQISVGYHYWRPGAQYPLITCQHGQSECLGNLIQACAMEILDDADQKVQFVMCMAHYGTRAGVELSSYNCAQKLGIELAPIKACTKSSRGHALMLQIGKLTQDTGVKHVPWVMVNGQHTLNDTLTEPICRLANHPKSEACILASRTHKHVKKKHCGGSGGSLLSKRTRAIAAPEKRDETRM